MAGGKRYKFNGSTISVLTDFPTDTQAITGITNAEPPVVTSTSHGLSDGDVVLISGVVGMVEANGVFIVESINANTFSLIDADATAWGTWSSGGNVEVGTFSNFCELTGYNRQGGTSPEIDATTLCSTAREYEIGLPDFGTTQLDYNFAPQTAIQLAVDTFYRSGDITAVKVVLPNSGGTMVQLGFVQQTSETAGVDGIFTGSMTLRNTGPRADFA